MSKPKLPKAPPTPSPVAEDVTENLAGDLLKEDLKRKKGIRATLLTRGQRSSRVNSLLGSSSSNQLGQ